MKVDQIPFVFCLFLNHLHTPAQKHANAFRVLKRAMDSWLHRERGPKERRMPLFANPCGSAAIVETLAGIISPPCSLDEIFFSLNHYVLLLVSSLFPRLLYAANYVPKPRFTDSQWLRPRRRSLGCAIR